MLSPRQQREILRNAIQYAKGTKAGGWFSRLGQKFGAFGEVLGMVVDILSGGGHREPSRRDVSDAIDLLGHHGFRVQPGPSPPGPQPPPPIIVGSNLQRPSRSQAPAITTRVRGVPVVPPVRPELEFPAEIWPEEQIISTLPTRVRGAFDMMPKDVTGMSPEILLESSNIYSVAFDEDEGILYVRFRAEGAPIGYKTMTSICSGKEHKVGIRAAVPGVLYAYGSAHRRMTMQDFQAFISAHSPGQHLWSNYRVCGSQWEHQVPYSIVDAPQGHSIPRRATRRGLRVRSVPNVGMGRRGFRSSTLPERLR